MAEKKTKKRKTPKRKAKRNPSKPAPPQGPPKGYDEDSYEPEYIPELWPGLVSGSPSKPPASDWEDRLTRWAKAAFQLSVEGGDALDSVATAENVAFTTGRQAKRMGLSEKQLTSWSQSAYGKVWVAWAALRPALSLKEVQTALLKGYRKASVSGPATNGQEEKRDWDLVLEFYYPETDWLGKEEALSQMRAMGFNVQADKFIGFPYSRLENVIDTLDAQGLYGETLRTPQDFPQVYAEAIREGLGWTVVASKGVGAPTNQIQVEVDPEERKVWWVSEDDERTYIDASYGPAQEIAQEIIDYHGIGATGVRDLIEDLQTSNPLVGYITGLEVGKTDRGHGLGSAMLRGVVDALVGEGVEAIWVLAGADNPNLRPELRRFYQRNGFDLVAEGYGPAPDLMIRPVERVVGTPPPHGFEWHDPEGPPPPSAELRQRLTGKKNVAKILQNRFERTGGEAGSLFHGTTRSLLEQIKQEGLKAQSEWGRGRRGIFCWQDPESAMNWANYWYGHRGMIVQVNPAHLEEVFLDKDAGNEQWAGWLHPSRKGLGYTPSKSYIVLHDLPPEALWVWDAESYDELRENHQEDTEDSEGLNLLFRLSQPQFVPYKPNPSFARRTPKA